MRDSRSRATRRRFRGVRPDTRLDRVPRPCRSAAARTRRARVGAPSPRPAPVADRPPVPRASMRRSRVYSREPTPNRLRIISSGASAWIRSRCSSSPLAFAAQVREHRPVHVAVEPNIQAVRLQRAHPIKIGQVQARGAPRPPSGRSSCRAGRADRSPTGSGWRTASRPSPGRIPWFRSDGLPEVLVAGDRGRWSAR